MTLNWNESWNINSTFVHNVAMKTVDLIKCNVLLKTFLMYSYSYLNNVYASSHYLLLLYLM